ncbi:PiggyBac transposase Uribo1 [Elysia marginata]|uniref:PiggyBac transposase Uribo1 n=1 Tax=Elysia marginata TaxID=1093978 RepID=A0AAV4EN07_9GAST|nr:PiggyBac transposase Uribo1 [Elysia marginata]
MGLNHKNVCSSYWTTRKSQATPYFGFIMGVDEFNRISRMIHLNDVTREIPRGREGYDPWSKIRPLLDKIKTKSKQYYTPFHRKTSALMKACWILFTLSTGRKLDRERFIIEIVEHLCEGDNIVNALPPVPQVVQIVGHRLVRLDGRKEKDCYDPKAVCVLSNFHDPGARGIVNRRLGRQQQQQVEVPLALSDYQKCMMGVDLTDQMVGYYMQNHR